jgi:hypothetical protein
MALFTPFSSHIHHLNDGDEWVYSQAALMMMDRPLCPACIDPIHRCVPCQTSRFTRSSLESPGVWAAWLQSISLLAYFVPRGIVMNTSLSPLLLVIMLAWMGLHSICHRVSSCTIG